MIKKLAAFHVFVYNFAEDDANTFQLVQHILFALLQKLLLYLESLELLHGLEVLIMKLEIVIEHLPWISGYHTID